jgi:cytochrome c oxidase subunit II
VPPSFPVLQPESPQAQAMFDLFLSVLGISAIVFAIVAGLIWRAIVVGRKRVDLPAQEFGSHRKEIFWMVGPVIIVLWIVAISAKLILAMNAIPRVHPPEDMPADEELHVTGHQWWWEIHYADTDIVAANEIHIPIGKKIRVKLTSADVIHCFWVPQLARKIDVIPGHENYIWLEANTPGVYQGRCAEFCGNQHAWMNFQVFALDEADHAKWLAGAGTSAAKPKAADADAAAGEKIFFTQMCVNCHTIKGTAATASIGPDLTHIASRDLLGGGVIKNTPDNLRLWLHNPQAIKPGCKMPDFKLSEEQVRQVAAYLESIN